MDWLSDSAGFLLCCQNSLCFLPLQCRLWLCWCVLKCLVLIFWRIGTLPVSINDNALWGYFLNQLRPKKLTSSFLLIVVGSHLNYLFRVFRTFNEAFKRLVEQTLWLNSECVTCNQRILSKLFCIRAGFKYVTDRLIQGLFTVDVINYWVRNTLVLFTGVPLHSTCFLLPTLRGLF